MTPSNIAAIVLAAGQSKRYGRNKLVQLLPDGKSLVAHAVETALGAACKPVVVVTGAYEQDISKALTGRDVHLVHNQNWEEGMGTSIACGVLHMMRQPKLPEAFFILLADQPGIHPNLLREMMNLFERHSPVAIRCNYGASSGPPVLFSATLANELSQLKGEEGARSVLKKYREKVLEVPFPEGKHDIDHPEDWE